MNLKEVISKQGYALGGFISLSSPSIVEIFALSGLDFVIIDTEHGESDFKDVIHMVRAAEAHEITAIVRTTNSEPKLLGRLLDNGVHGVQVPMVEDAQMAKEIISAVKYPPVGSRGMSGGRGCMWGAKQNYLNTANDELITVVMCETKKGIENIEEIVQTPYVDVVFVGCGDLSLSLGHPGEMNHPEIEQGALKVLEACNKYGVIPGIVTSSVAEAKKRINQGFKYVTIANDMRLLHSSLRLITNEIKK